MTELQAIGAEKAAVTIESLIAEAEAVRVLAMENMQFGAAVSALTLKAKLAGLWDRPAPSMVNNPNMAFIDAPPPETYEQWQERTSRRRGRGDARVSEFSID